MEYRTTKGRLYGFPGWFPGEHPVECFDRGEYMACLHGAMFAASRLGPCETVKIALEDDGILHELVHLVAGIDICLHNSMDDLRADLVKLIDEATPTLRAD